MDEDIGLAFLNNPFDSKREEPELPQSLGIFERLKSALRKVQDVSKEEEEKTVEPPAVEEAHGEEEALVIDDGQTDDAIAEVILNSDKEEVAVYAKQTDFISFDADDTVEEKEQDTTTTRQNPMRDEWKRGLSSNEIRDRNEEIIEKLTIVRDEPVWFNSRQKFHPQSSNYGGDSLAALFQEEILDFVEYMSPTDHEHAVREYIVGRVQSLVTSIWSDAQVKVFGSFHTKLYLPSSDMDLVVLTDPRSTTISDKTCLNKIAKAIEKSGLAHEGRVEVINAKVPIVKFTDSVGQFSVDISCNIANGITAAERMSELIKQHPALRPLTMVLKQFLLMRGLNEVFSGGLGSYGLTLMITSFLQLHPRIQSGEIRQEQNLGVLLIQFFELYGKRFNYDGVGIRTADHEYFSLMTERRQSGLVDMRKEGGPRLTVIDPDDENNNITRGTYGLRLIRSAFARASDILVGAFYEQQDRNVRRNSISNKRKMRFTVKSLLATVVQVPESVEAHRRFVERVYVDNRQQIEDNIWPLASVAVGRKRSRTPSSDPADGSNESSPNKRAKSSNSSGSNNKAKKRKVKAAKKKKKRKFQTF